MSKKGKKPTGMQNESIGIIKDYFNHYVISNPVSFDGM